MIFGKGKIVNLYYGDNKINQVDSLSYLGVKLHRSGNSNTQFRTELIEFPGQ